MKYLFIILLGLASIQAAKVKIAWDPSLSTNVVGYIVRLGPASTNKFVQFDVGTNLTALVTNVPDNITVYMDIVCYNNLELLSLPSNELVFETTPPTAPRNLKLTNGPVTIQIIVDQP